MSARFEDDRPLTLSAFLAWERRQPERYEYVGNEIRMMVGGTVNHARIAGNLFFHLRRAGEPRGCQAFFEMLKVIAADQVHYPDVVMSCSPQSGRGDVLADPALIVEVLSPSTAHVDRGPKWHNYQTITSLQAYLLVAQDRPRVDAYLRQPNGWAYVIHTGMESAVTIPALDLALPLAEIYSGVDFGNGA
ncbi:MAG TPA: Uma2 family endonuclease [Azospirillum sp.]